MLTSKNILGVDVINLKRKKRFKNLKNNGGRQENIQTINISKQKWEYRMKK